MQSHDSVHQRTTIAAGVNRMRNPMNNPNRRVMVKIMFEDLRPDEIVDVRESCKMPEFFENSCH